jgi:hypothetical protein
MDCRFCGAEMADGWVAVRSPFSMGKSDGQLQWEPAEIRYMKRRWRDIGRRGVVTLFPAQLFGRRERAAALCPECGAVEIDPSSPVRQSRRTAVRNRKNPTAPSPKPARHPEPDPER